MKIFKTKLQRDEEKAKKNLERERAKFRKPEVVGADYGKLAAEAGDKQYQIDVFKAELREINKRLHVLSHEYQNSTRVHGEPKDPEATNQLKTSPTDEQKQAAIAMLNSTPEAPSENEVESVQ